ncbi:hypothetical protein EJB05_18545, partial [Eragrostis curvula]
MRGQRRLRIAPVGVIRRRWASVLATEEAMSGKFGQEEDREDTLSTEEGCRDEIDDGVEWNTPVESLRVAMDPLSGLRPEGFKTRFWGAGNDVPSPPASTPSSPSTASMRKKAGEAGFSVAEIDATALMLEDPVISAKVLATSTPTSMDQQTTLARKVVSTLFEGRRLGKPWRGPLPPPRTSPPMTLGACTVKDQRGEPHRSSSGGRRSGEEDEVQISNLDPVSTASPKVGRAGLKREVSIWNGSGWTRFRCNALGRLMSRKGRLPDCYRRNQSLRTLPTAGGDCRPTYAAIVRGARMDGRSAHGAAGFNGGGNPGFPGAFGGGPGGGHPGAFGGGNGGGGQFQGGYHGDGRGPPHGWGGAPHGQQMAPGGGNNVPMHGGPMWNSFMPQHGGALGNNGGFGGNQMGNGGFMPPNHPNSFPNNQQGGVSQEGMAMGYGSANFNQVGASFDPGYGGPNSGQNRGGPRQRGRGRGSRGGRNQGSRGGRQDSGGGRGHVGLNHQQQAPLPPTNAGVNDAGNAVPANSGVTASAKSHVNTGGTVITGTKSHAGPSVVAQGAKNVLPTALVPQNKTVFLKPAVIDHTVLEEGQCSKENDIGEDEMNVDIDEEPDKDLETGNNKGKKDKEKWCFRCCSKGHVKEVCTANLFCTICESEEHVAARCPMKRKPRPMAYAVGYAVDQLGFYHIPHGPINMTKKDGLTALIKVKGGHLKEEELIGHLKRLVPGKFEWDVQLHAPDTWIAPFPSKAELKRTINFGAADLKDEGQRKKGE